jgi:predicted transcriptional regulator
MITNKQRITIIRSSRPVTKGVNDEIKWFGNSLGLFGLRDRDSSCFRIFVELLKSLRDRKTLSSDSIAYSLKLSRGTVIHHLNRLMEAGIVVSEKRRYMLRVNNLEVLVDEIEKDIERACSDLKKVAEKIDKELGL